jgi:hypothetical protein
VAQVPGALELRKFGQPVVLTAKADPGKPALELDVKQTSAGATVAFRYPAEGISGTFDLGTDDLGRWNVRRHELHEK